MGLHWRKLLTLGVLAVSVPLIVGCGKYEKILKGTDAELQYKMALEYYTKGKYSKAQSLFERCVPVYRVTQRADSLGYYLSDCYFHTSSYVLAGFSFDQLVQNYPRSPFAEDAEFMSAYCLYKASPRPELDQEYTLKAIAGFEHFVEQHPMSTRTPEANTMLKELYGKLLTKSYNGAYQYYWQRNYRAAVAALQQSLLDYPITPTARSRCTYSPRARTYWRSTAWSQNSAHATKMRWTTTSRSSANSRTLSTAMRCRSTTFAP